MQLSRDFRNLDRLAFERERRSACCHLKLRHLGQKIEQLLLNAISEKRIVLVFGKVAKWQNRNALRRDVCRRRGLRDGSIVPPGEQREGGSDNPDQTSRNSQSAGRFPTVENLCAAILQLRRECTDTRTRGWFRGKHRHEQRNKAARNAGRLQLFDRQSSRALARANLFDGSALERPFADEQIPESCA